MSPTRVSPRGNWGGALALSVLWSVVGFWALSLAPTPIFATFGTLTPVRVALASAGRGDVRSRAHPRCPVAR